MKLFVLIQLLAVLLSSAPSFAKDLPQLAFPLACTLGEECWVAKYADVDPAQDSARDFTCGLRTEEAHEGTDFALRSYADLEVGVDVLAARGGKVLRLRDGEPDGPKSPAAFESIKAARRECGNGIVLDHGQGLLTFYCHLKNASLKVKTGEIVTEGQPIAQVGQSGLAEFPHLHFSVIQGEGHIDPYTGRLRSEGCGLFKDNLWKDDQAYMPFALYDAGFTGAAPDFAQVETGKNRPDVLYSHPSEIQEALVFWMAYFGAREGDQIDLIITGPDGVIYTRKQQRQDKTRARQYYYVGKKLSTPLQPGLYTGTATVHRDGAQDQTLSRTIEIRD